jgi:hypothetical protein
MALNALNAAFGIAKEYEDLVLIGDLEDEDLENPGVGQLSSSASSHGKIKKRGRPLGSVKQVVTKIVKISKKKGTTKKKGKKKSETSSSSSSAIESDNSDYSNSSQK